MRFDAPRPDELDFIYDSWARSYRKSPWAGTIPNHLWDQVSRAASSELLTRSRVIVGVVDLPSLGDPGASAQWDEAAELVRTTSAPAPLRRVLCYSVSEPGVLHWLYVKRDARRLGYGRRLLDETIKQWGGVHAPGPIYTHKTRSCERFLRGWRWDPVPARVRR